MNCPHCGGLVPLLPGKINQQDWQLLKAIAAGLSNKEILPLTSYTESSLKNRLTILYKKLSISRSGLVRYWSCELFQLGLKELHLT